MIVQIAGHTLEIFAVSICVIFIAKLANAAIERRFNNNVHHQRKSK